MSKDWVKDIVEMQGKYGTRDWVANADVENLKRFLDFRLAFIEEEFEETLKAIVEDDAEEIVDGLIDLMKAITESYLG